MAVCRQVSNFLFYFIFQQKRGHYFTCTAAYRTIFRSVDIHFRTHSLTSNLAKSEFRDRQYRMFGTVGFHESFHCLLYLALIVRKLHIDEINHNDAANISQTQLSGNFFCSLQVRLQCILLLVTTHTFITTVHINDMQGLGMFNDQISPTG